jgi:acyl-homoserine lactone acylase PvdQ
LRVEKEVFKVRFGSDFVFENKFTIHGPLLYKPSRDDLGFSIWFPLEFLNQNNNLNYSLRWVYHSDIENKVFSISKELLQGKPSLKRMENFLESQNIFPLNMNFITSDGDIGYHMTGLFPLRKYSVS